MDASFSSTTPKRSEKDEKAISEIYKTLVTSFNPGKHLVFSFFISVKGYFLLIKKNYIRSNY
jgi:hypothetical protein